MHQHPRPSPSAASPSSPRSNPLRTNNQRESFDSNEPRQPMAAPASPSEGQAPAGPSQDSILKLTQIVQNYFTKAAQIIIQSRMDVAPLYLRDTNQKRVNKWFNVELDETEAFRQDLRPWRQSEPATARSMPLVIETYIDVADLSPAHSLAFVDEHGKPWMVNDALDPHSTDGRRPSRTQVILERWIIELGNQPAPLPTELGLPIVYKKSIIMFRSLYTYAKVLPAGKLSLRLKRATFPTSDLLVRCRVLNENDLNRPAAHDTLELPFDLRPGKVTDTFSFGSIDSPAGPFSVKVIYRSSCDFRIEDNEALLSSQFVNMDERLFRPSLGDRRLSTSPRVEVGSLPSNHKRYSNLIDPGQAYGSLSSFHHVGPPLASSPISALRAAGDMGPESPSSTSPPQNVRSGQGSRISLRGSETGNATPRRPSVSFSPFKGPVLSQSPSTNDQALAQRDSPSKGVPASLPQRNRLSLGPMSPSSRLHGESFDQPQNSVPIRPGSMPRFSSSFGHRRNRYSMSAASRTEDENNSSGRGSVASSVVAPSSGVIGDQQQNVASSSVTTDEENISDFLKFLDAKKTLKSFTTPQTPAAIEGSTRRTAMALSKYQKMKNANDNLSVSISSSMLLNRSSTPASRQLSEVPPLVGGISMSSSPGKPISPHTPHTPAIPSRLSANSIAEYTNLPRRSRGPSRASESEREARDIARAEPEPIQRIGTAPLDIPISPRPLHSHVRRSSSVSQQHRAAEDDTSDIFGHRSASLGDERSVGQDRLPSLSGLLHRHEASQAATDDLPESPQLAAEDSAQQSLEASATAPISRTYAGYTSRSRNPSFQRRRGSSSGQGFYSSLVNNERESGTPAERSGSGSGGSGRGSSALWWQHGYNARASTNNEDDGEEDELVPFAMSEISTQVQSRRSLENVASTTGVAGPRQPGPPPSRDRAS